MSQNITSFFTPIDLTGATPPTSPQPSSPHIPSRRSPRNHVNNKKRYVPQKQIKKNKNPDRLKKENLTFKEAWKIGRPWLEHQVINDKNYMFCTICQKANGNSLWATTGSDTMKLEYIKKHENSTEHKNSLQILDPGQTSIKEGVNQMLGMEAENVVTQMRNIYFLSLKNISINVYPDLASLVNYQKENPTSLVSDTPLQVLQSPTLPHQQKTQTSRSNYATYTNKVSGHELLGSLVRPIEEAVINEIRSSSCWSLLVDESNTISTGEKTLALVSKHMVNNIPTLRYLGITAVSDTSAESLLKAIDLFILQKGLPADKLYHFGSDGASNMTGLYYSKNGLLIINL